MTVKCIYNNSYNPDKPNIGFFELSAYSKLDYIRGTYYQLKIYFKLRGFNIISISHGIVPSSDCTLHIPLAGGLADVRAKLNRAADVPNASERAKLNESILDSFLLSDDFINLPKLDRLIVDTTKGAWLPPANYIPRKHSKRLYSLRSSFFDSVDQVDATELDYIKEKISQLKSNWSHMISPYAFSRRIYHFYFFALHRLIISNDIKNIDALIIDTASYTPGIDTYSDRNVRLMYFADDTRGTRNLMRFPIAELQIEHDKQVSVSRIPNNLSADFIFYGSILQTAYTKRLAIWSTYLKDINVGNNTFLIPLTLNGIINANKSDGLTSDNIYDDMVRDTFNEIKNHKYFKGHTLPNELNSYIIKHNFKYTLISHCATVYDSLNFRLIHNLHHGLLPFIDPEYDPDYLQIPRRFQDILRVINSDEINDKITFYNNNDDRRIQLLTELQNYFLKPKDVIYNELDNIFHLKSNIGELN